MKNTIHLLIEKLFEDIPFSIKSETMKNNLQQNMFCEYDEQKSKGENEIKIIQNILIDSDNMEALCKKYNYSYPEIQESLSAENVLSQAEVRKYFKKYKRYLLLLSLCGMFLFNLVYSTLCYFSLRSFLVNLLLAGASVGVMIATINKAKKFLLATDFFECKMDSGGREFIQRMYDRYAKKSINMVCILIAFLFYALFTIALSVLSSKYTISDVLQQISYHTSVLFVILFLTAKNFMCIHSLSRFFIKEKAIYYYRQLKKIAACSASYWLFMNCLLLLLNGKLDGIFNIYLMVICIYFGIVLAYNITLRKQLVFRNLTINIKRIVSVSMIVLVAVLYTIMSLDTYFTLPYINKVSVVASNDNLITYNEDTGVYTITTDKDDFKVLQLTDIHLGGSAFSITKDLKALHACYTLLKATEPDFVVVTGDLVFPMGIMSFSLNNRAPVEQFAAFMRNTGIPWAFTYGNHDTESMACITADEFDDLMKSLSFKNSHNLLYPYIQPDIYGRSNQMIEIRNTDGTLMQALFLIDSNDYTPESFGINEYDYIRDDQVEWYRKQVLALKEKEGKLINSMIFFHIPLQEYKLANDLYENGSDEVKYHYGILGETMIDKICCSDYPSKLFDTAVELGSTKAMFCGHDHYNNQSLEYKGIRLTYGYSIDYLAMPGIEDDVEQRGATLITIHKSGDFTIEPYQLMNIK